ncbi:MAG: formylglycine-generating enzyme family protein [Pseudomonadota bacterium]
MISLRCLIAVVMVAPGLSATQSALAMLPECQLASSDSDGDGYGWENNQSCLVVQLNDSGSAGQTTTLPVCESASSDSDGDGYGWENNASCLVKSSGDVSGSSPATPDTVMRPTCASTDSDPDEDGYGWENNATCLVIQDTLDDPTSQEDVIGAVNESAEISQSVPVLIKIESGCFDIGSPDNELNRSGDEGPQYNICVETFMAGQYEVTFSQYDKFATATGRPLPDDEGFGRGNRPVMNVNWNDAIAYTRWLSGVTGSNFRLPTEAEWEYMARSGTVTTFNTGNTITTDQANFQGQQSYNGSVAGVFRHQTLPVGSFAANAFGLYDMHGNIMEWTCSEYVGDYRSMQAPMQCSNTDSGRRVLRGGDWTSVHRNVRSAWRNNLTVGFTFRSIGFRVVQQ